MNKRKYILLVALLSVVLLAAFYAKYYEQNHRQEIKQEQLKKREQEILAYIDNLEGKTLPNISWNNLEGIKIFSNDNHSSPKVLFFWASWCPDCQKSWPIVQELSNKYGNHIEFVAINLPDGKKETKDTGQSYLKDKGYLLEYFYDDGLEASKLLDIKAIPTIMIIDDNKQIVDVFVENVTEEQMELSLKKFY